MRKSKSWISAFVVENSDKMKTRQNKEVLSSIISIFSKLKSNILSGFLKDTRLYTMIDKYQHIYQNTRSYIPENPKFAPHLRKNLNFLKASYCMK
jgi:ribosomal protein S17E